MENSRNIRLNALSASRMGWPPGFATQSGSRRFRYWIARAKSTMNGASNFPSDEMSDTLPDRLSVNPKSPHYDEKLLERGVGIKFNGAEKTNVEEYCVSEGWIKVVAGKSLDRHGNPMTIKLKGAVEPYFHKPAENAEG